MKQAKTSLVVACLGLGTALASVGAEAQGNAYVEAGLTQLTWSGGGLSVKPTNALVRVGYDFTKNLAGELVATASVSSDTVQGISFKVDSGYGAYLKGKVDVAPNFELFARAGWVHATLSGAFMGISVSTSDSSFSYGAGLQYLFTKNWYVQGDYASYYDKSGDTIKGPSVSVGYRF
jgi:outer membrane autotransporter protein